MTKEELIQEAFKALKNSYSPYSGYPVGAAVLTRDGRIFWGANIENASFPAGTCAENSAVLAAYSRGVRKEDIEAIAIVSNGKTLATPCGVCRQVLSELLEPGTPIYLSNGKEAIATSIAKLLPYSFGSGDLG